MKNSIRSPQSRFIRGWASCLPGILFLSLPCGGYSAKPAELRLEVQALHPQFRQVPGPSGNREANTNPPVFLWPVAGNPYAGEAVSYDFRLSRNRQFPTSDTVKALGISYAIHNPHKPLQAGTWYWQYKGSAANNWSEIQSFHITENTPRFETPEAGDLIAAIPESFPRVLVMGETVEAFRHRVKDSEDRKGVLRQADRLTRQSPPSEEHVEVDYSNATSQKERDKLRLDASKELGIRAGQGVELFCKAYLLTGNETYARAAMLWADEIARWDPHGVSMVNDFGDSQCMLALAYVLDACGDLLSDEQMQAYLASITTRGNRFYLGWTNMLEAKVYSAHVWQHILERLFKTSIITRGRITEADSWLEYCYEVWLARAPVLGPEDGGWWNGTSYFELNVITLLDIPLILEKLTGANFFHSRFYENNPHWLIYSFPANSYSEGFGNGTEKQWGQRSGVLGYADALSRVTRNPYAAWYVDHQLKEKGMTLHEDDAFRWFRLKWRLPERPAPIRKLNLPLAQAFPQTGTVNMHTSLDNPTDNLMVSLRSSPFGSSSHSHADQNSFNIQYGGDKLYYNSGHRPSMGVPHYTDWFKASIGHNTVLIDGKGQPGGSGESFGWIPRFLHGERISYCLGDASNAYDTEEEEPQKAGLTKFRRHLLFLRPSTVVVYDELEADHKADWSWLIHSPYEITPDYESMSIECDNGKTFSHVYFFGSSKMDLKLSTRFDPEPVNYRGLKDEQGKVIEYKDQWHVSVEASGKSMRYLAVFQILPEAGFQGFHEVQTVAPGSYEVGGWRIKAGLDLDRPAYFEITDAESKRGILFGGAALTLGDETFKPEHDRSTLLVEKVDGQTIMKEAVDELPLVKH